MLDRKVGGSADQGEIYSVGAVPVGVQWSSLVLSSIMRVSLV